MSFEFLAPDAVQPFEGESPAPRSPIEWVHRGAGAEIAERSGWRMVTGYGGGDKEAAACRTKVGVADLSFLGKLEVQGSADTVAAIVASLAGGAALELARATLHEEVWWCPLTPSRVLAVTPPERTASLRSELEAAATSGSFVAVTELTAAFTSNAVVGPLARETFARTTALDMRPQRFGEAGFAPVSVARTPGMVLRRGENSFLHLAEAGYAAYTWEVFVDAAESLGGRAVGVDALSSAIASEAAAGA